MKKFILTIVTAILACCTFLFASGCALFDTSVEGTYYFNKLTYTEAGMTVEIKEGEKFMGMLILEKDYVVFTLNEDGTGRATHNGEEEIFTWTKTDDIITMIDDEGEIIYATWSVRKLVLEEYEDGITMQITLKK